jgi:integrase
LHSALSCFRCVDICPLLLSLSYGHSIFSESHVQFSGYIIKDNARQGFFEHEQFERVVECLPDDLKDYVCFAYFTGWRKREVAQLAWRHIEGEVVRLPPEISKNKEGRVLVLGEELAEIIARRHAARRDLMPLVFYRATGRPVRYFYRSWKTACRKAAVPLERLFHDFRRTAVRNMTRAGVPEKITMDIAGHKTRAIFDRYNITNEEDIRQGLAKMQAHLRTLRHKIVTLENHG